MYNPSKFNYVAMQRSTTEAGRQYVAPDGNRLPSVTTILDATAPPERKQALQNWRKRVGPAKAQEITSEAAGRGTRMHKFLEDYVKTGTIGECGSNPYSIQSHAMATTIINNGLRNCSEYWGTEVGLYYPEIYAGTTDLVGVHDGQPAIMDFKQSNRPKQREWIDDYFLQLCAYANAHDAVHGTTIRRGVIFMCTPDNYYQEFIIEHDQFEHYSNAWFKRVEMYYTRFV